jgi:glycerate 2-kinase
MTLAADQMRALFATGVAAANPQGAVAAALRAHPAIPAGRLFVLAVGKAACAMAQAALPLLPAPARALVVTNPENAVPVAGAEVMQAAHPVPDAGGLVAGRAVLAMLAGTVAGDEVLVLVSGGGSALLPAPVAGLTLADKAAVNRLLLGAGLDIVQMNMVRQHLSELKGGGLLRAAFPAGVRALILSDVVGDDLRAIASGPTVAPIARRGDVVAMLRDAALWDALPNAARMALLRPEDATPLPPARNLLIGSNALSVAAMARACAGARVSPAPLVGDVAQAAGQIVALVDQGAGTTLLGGETTVTLRGTGRGGRNQELALRVAVALQGRAGWRFLSGGTDGRDGPTDAAGALVDGGTVARIRGAGGDVAALLANNDSYAALKLAGDLLITGGTGTNVADLQILCVDA